MERSLTTTMSVTGWIMGSASPNTPLMLSMSPVTITLSNHYIQMLTRGEYWIVCHYINCLATRTTLQYPPVSITLTKYPLETWQRQTVPGVTAALIECQEWTRFCDWRSSLVAAAAYSCGFCAICEGSWWCTQPLKCRFHWWESVYSWNRMNLNMKRNQFQYP